MVMVSKIRTYCWNCSGEVRLRFNFWFPSVLLAVVVSEEGDSNNIAALPTLPGLLAMVGIAADATCASSSKGSSRCCLTAVSMAAGSVAKAATAASGGGGAEAEAVPLLPVASVVAAFFRLGSFPATTSDAAAANRFPNMGDSPSATKEVPVAVVVGSSSRWWRAVVLRKRSGFFFI